MDVHEIGVVEMRDHLRAERIARRACPCQPVDANAVDGLAGGQATSACTEEAVERDDGHVVVQTLVLFAREARDDRLETADRRRVLPDHVNDAHVLRQDARLPSPRAATRSARALRQQCAKKAIRSIE